MFLGKHERNLDEKGRLAITIAPDNCLRVYPPAEWERVTGQSVVDAANSAAERTLIRNLFAAASPLELDAQGRTLLPANLRQRAGIAGSAVVVGVNNVVEIWSQERWDAEETTSDFTALADEVAVRRADSH
jgi:MraZ protein